MIRTSILLEDDRLTPLLDTLLQQFSPQGQAAILQEAGRRVGRIVVLRYPPQLPPMPDRMGRRRKAYRRTGKLARSLEFTVRSASGNSADVRVAIPDNSPAGAYARYVVGTDLQRSEYFKRSNWKVLTFMIEDQQEEITQAVAVVFEQAFEDLGI